MPPTPTAPTPKIRFIPLSYNNADSESSARRLVLSVRPDWQDAEGPLEFVRFTDGITNTLLKAVKKRPGHTEVQIDEEAILLRAYGKGTEVLIDRDRECTSHSLLSQHSLAPPLLARFQNGLLYKFIRGRVCTPPDLTREPIWRGVAQRLSEWHAVLPLVSAVTSSVPAEANGPIIPPIPTSKATPKVPDGDIAPGIATPNVWSVMQKWIHALPTTNDAETTRKQTLQTELARVVKELAYLPGSGKDGLVFAHCDLLSGNVIVQERVTKGATNRAPETVSFIDYEYATPAPAAFDIANFFAEWGGFECDYNAMPSRAQRTGFLAEYLQAYDRHLSGVDHTPNYTAVQDLFEKVDRFRGVPGLYWGIWALIQATISQIDFDYASYAEVRLGEYWAWRAEVDGSRARAGTEMPLRERMWARDS
ncbi:MAG: hypothetical protein M1817_004155 [Caeruleum heppii]|nr:MAG: hypothetical protein M1817_004155 [Caeruleum heppii]